MAFFSHLRPKRIRIIPTTRRKIPIGTNWTSATPRVATITARVAAAAKAPASELRQLIVTPTTRTIVKASTNSTAEARKAATRTAHCEANVAMSLGVANGTRKTEVRTAHCIQLDSY